MPEANTDPTSTIAELGDFHRIGGCNLENLRLKQIEIALSPPGISLLCCSSPQLAAQQMRAAFPNVKRLHEAASTVASISLDRIRAAGFDNC